MSLLVYIKRQREAIHLSAKYMDTHTHTHTHTHRHLKELYSVFSVYQEAAD